MLKRIPLFILFTSLLNVVTALQAQTITVKTNKFKKKRFVQFVITADETDDDCDVSLYAAANRGALKGDYSKATLLGSVSLNAEAQTVLATKIPLASATLSKEARRVYVRANAECDSFTATSNIRRFLIPQSQQAKGVRSAKKWIRKVAKKVITNSVTLVNAFPALNFTRPVDFQSPGSHSDILYVVLQEGEIHAISPNGDSFSSSLFLDLKSVVEYNEGEQGLLGLAFHPDVQNNREFFVYYTEAGTNGTVVARYRISEANELIADVSEERILATPQPAKNHNGGSIHFGPDGFLYIALGDGGGSNDTYENGQDPTTLLGSILRIDVDKTTDGNEYAIPSDNPMVDNGDGFKEEIYAYGLRNPWRISFDPNNGTLWAADVGQGSFEEVNIIRSGRNYGWNTMEGFVCFESPGCDTTGLTKPVVAYGRTLGRSVTGGYVYRGSAVRKLRGFYVYADFITGRIWAVKQVGKRAVWTQLVDTEVFIPAFGTDSANELYVLGFDGLIYTLEAS